MSKISDYLELAIREAESGNSDFRLTLSFRDNPGVWLQIAWDSFNFAYPLTEEPLAAIRRTGIALPKYVSLTEWQSQRYVTFEHGAEPVEELTHFVEKFLKNVLSTDPSPENVLLD